MSRPDADAGPRPTLRELEALRAMVETGKTTAAAHLLGVSQPAVSRALAQLEQRTGRRLFRRDSGRLVPTAAALALNEEIEPILAALARLDRYPWTGREGAALRVAAPPTIAHRFLASLIAGFLKEEPAARLHLEIGTTLDVAAQVADGKADIGLTDTPIVHAGLAREPFRRAIAHCAMPARHRLAKLTAISPRDLDDQPFVALTRRFSARAVYERLFMDAGVRPRILVETATSASAVELVREGIGVALVNPFPLALRADAGIVYRPFRPEVGYETAFLLPAQSPIAPLARRFIDFVRARQPEDGLTTALR